MCLFVSVSLTLSLSLCIYASTSFCPTKPPVPWCSAVAYRSCQAHSVHRTPKLVCSGQLELGIKTTKPACSTACSEDVYNQDKMVSSSHVEENQPGNSCSASSYVTWGRMSTKYERSTLIFTYETVVINTNSSKFAQHGISGAGTSHRHAFHPTGDVGRFFRNETPLLIPTASSYP